MAEAILYAQERPGAPVTSMRLAGVEGVTELRIVTTGMTYMIPFGPVLRSIKGELAGKPTSGKADLILVAAGKEIDLAKRENAVAVAVEKGQWGNAIYWLDGGQCTEITQVPIVSLFRSLVEGRYPTQL